MSSLNFVRAFIRESKLRIETARSAFMKRAYSYCIRQSQEAVELGLKAALRLIGIDYPKWHDVGGVLEKEKGRFPAWFQNKISTLEKISALLAAQREASMYGNDLSMKDPMSLFTVHDARKALKETCQVFAIVKKLVNNVSKNP